MNSDFQALKLKGRVNYRQWAIYVKGRLCEKKVLSAIQIPAADSDNEQEAEERGCIAMTVIVESLDPQVFNKVRDAHDALEMWSMLESLYLYADEGQKR